MHFETHSSIGESAFNECGSLTSVYIPASVTSIGNEAFALYYLQRIYGEAGSYAETYAKDYRIPFITDADFEFIVDENGILTGCSDTPCGDIVIPDEIDGKKIVAIGNRAFYEYYSITSIGIPASVTRIGENAFYGCSSLENVSFPSDSKLTNIENHAFESCRSLISIRIPAGVTEISYEAFAWCRGLTDVDIPADSQLSYIHSYAFEGCGSLTGITIPEHIDIIGDSAFEGCSNLTIYGVVGSKAETYAEQNGIPFESVTVSSTSEPTATPTPSPFRYSTNTDGTCSVALHVAGDFGLLHGL